MYKKVKVDQDGDFPVDILRVKESDGPDLPLFQFKGFGSRQIDNLKPTKGNYPRKSELIQEKLESLIASTLGFAWLVFGWPVSVFICDEGEFYFDHRHLVRAMKQNGWRHVPIAKYERRITGDETLDRLSNNSAMTLMGLRANATDNSANAGSRDFHIIRQCMEDDRIPITKSNVDKLLKVCGVYERFPKGGHKSTIGGIRNSILKTKVKSKRVFNTSKQEVKDWIGANILFGKNKPSSVDGVMCYHKVLDEGFYYRYANDILKWTWKAWINNEKVRVCASSYAICEHQIEAERQEMVDTIGDILDNTINWYISWVEKRFSNVGMNVKLPKVELSKLPLELYWIPQIDGETEAIRVDL